MRITYSHIQNNLYISIFAYKIFLIQKLFGAIFGTSFIVSFVIFFFFHFILTISCICFLHTNTISYIHETFSVAILPMLAIAHYNIFAHVNSLNYIVTWQAILSFSALYWITTSRWEVLWVGSVYASENITLVMY